MSASLEEKDNQSVANVLQQKQNISALIAGFLFALGLGISGMTDANKVLAFLTLNENWNPALMPVMGGAIGIHLVFYRMVSKKASPFFAEKFHIPTSKDINLKLVLGSLLFGIGWGLGGICPGPGMVSIFSGATEILAFVAAMLVGMISWQKIGAKILQ